MYSHLRKPYAFNAVRRQVGNTESHAFRSRNDFTIVDACLLITITVELTSELIDPPG